MNDYTWLGVVKPDRLATNRDKSKLMTAYDACNNHDNVQHVLC